MDKPELYPRWATHDLQDEVTSFPNKKAPSEEFKDTGLKDTQNFTRQHANYQFDQICQWITNQDERTSEVGSLLFTTATKTAQELTDKFGGTWVEGSGTETFGGFTVNVWNRTV